MALIHRDLLLASRARAEILNPVLFFVLVTALFPLAVSAAPQTLRTLAPGIIWVAALLASLLSLDMMFRSDFEDGTLEQLAVSPHPFPLLVLGKVIAHWTVASLPLVVVSPLLAVLMNYPMEAVPQLAATLLLGTPVISALGAVGVALTVGVRRGGVLLSLLILPLYVPVLIFGAGAADAAASGLPITGHLQLLAGMSVLAMTLAPLAAAAGLRISLE
ncbi:MAG: heme exporter protein CcmB [Ectothiorhodospiraceae bacterium]|jgi:heme exporter protein B